MYIYTTNKDTNNGIGKKTRLFDIFLQMKSHFCQHNLIIVIMMFFVLIFPSGISAQSSNSYYLVLENGFGKSNLQNFSKNIRVLSTDQKAQYESVLNKFLQSKSYVQMAKNQGVRLNTNDTFSEKISTALAYYQYLQSQGVGINKSFDNRLTNSSIEIIKISKNINTQLLNDIPGVKSIALERKYDLYATPNDPDFAGQWGLKSLGFETYWPNNKGSQDVVVAVIDDGFSVNHPDGGNIQKVESVCDVEYPSSTGHGMNVAGIIGASTNNAIGVSGVNEKVSILGITVLCGDGSGNGQITSSALIEALNIANDYEAKVVNMSLGGLDQDDVELEKSVKELKENGALIVVAAGNCGIDPSNQGCFVNGQKSTISSDKLYPANDPNVLTVTAYGQNKALASFASIGSSVDIAAPGVDILSLSGSGYKSMRGTSQSAPHVAGVAALLLAQNNKLTVDDLFDILKKNAKKGNSQFGAGELDVLQALQDPRVKNANNDSRPPASTSIPGPSDIPITSANRADKSYLKPSAPIVVQDCSENPDLIQSLQFECIDGSRGKVVPVDSICALAKDATVFAQNACRAKVEGGVHIEFLVKLQGVSNPTLNSMSVQVGVGGGKLDEPIFKSVSMTHVQGGVFKGSVDFNLVPGNDYSFYLKGPVHQRRKYCQNAPKEIFQGVYTCAEPKISLVDGNNELDLSTIPMLVGDLPNNEGVQDGIVNSRDIAQLRSAIDVPDVANTEFCDLNLDGACNAVDWSLLISALSVKGDER